jgi:putative endopeptidase
MTMVTTGAYAGEPTSPKSGIDITNMNKSVQPGADFFEYANGGWMQRNPLTAEYSRYGNFDKLAETNRKQLKGLINELAAKQNAEGSIAKKIGDLYNIAMDSAKLNSEGYAPIKPTLDAIAAIKQRKEILPFIARLTKEGIQPLFYTFIEADDKNAKMNLVQVMQGGLSLGQRDYYLETDPQTTKIREAFGQHIINMFMLCGFTQAEATSKAEAVMQIETRMAKPSKSATERRDPEANYHKMSYQALLKDFKGIDWNTYFGTLGMTGFKEIGIGQLEPIHEAEKILKEEPLDNLKALLQWKVINAAGSYLSDKIRAEKFDFTGRVLSGKQQDQARWKRAVGTVEGALGEAVGQLYVEKYFPAAAKERMLKLVGNLQKALGERIMAQEWMSDSTKKVALDKLAAFYVKVGYPNKWRDFSGLSIQNDSYWANVVRSNVFDFNYMIEQKLNKPVDRDVWGMTPQTVNAYYNPTTNEICFPAGILQYPFFDMQADDAFNYGAIGVVIGHEMTHGFDDQGRQYDKDGNLRAWWQPSDAERFKARTDALADFFSNINVLPDLKANGRLTLGENLADHGGLMVAYQAFKNATKEAPLSTEDGLTPEQRFFLAYANVWACNIRDAEIRVRTKSDPHSLARWRVNGTLPHIDMWYDAFGITEKDPMYLPKDKRVSIW